MELLLTGSTSQLRELVVGPVQDVETNVALLKQIYLKIKHRYLFYLTDMENSIQRLKENVKMLLKRVKVFYRNKTFTNITKYYLK